MLTVCIQHVCIHTFMDDGTLNMLANDCVHTGILTTFNAASNDGLHIIIIAYYDTFGH